MTTYINLKANRDVFRRLLLLLESIAPRFPGLFFTPPMSPFSRWMDVWLRGFLVWYAVSVLLALAVLVFG